MGGRNSRAIKENDVTPFTRKYELLDEQLGKGSFGTVYTCISRVTRRQYAVKKVEIKGFRINTLFHINNEAAIVSCLQHVNIVQYHEGFTERGYRYMVFEKIEGRYLFAEVCAKDHYSEKDARKYIEQILKAIQYCHQRGVVHRDLKPTNIMLQPANDNVKVIDFGLAVIARGNDRYCFGQAGCPLYMAPEVVAEMTYGRAVDMWACGLLLYNLLSGTHPFPSLHEHEVYDEIRSGRIDFPQQEFLGTSVVAVDLIRALLCYDDKERFTAGQALDHDFITDGDLTSITHRQATIDRLNTFHALVWQSEQSAFQQPRKRKSHETESLSSIRAERGLSSMSSIRG